MNVFKAIFITALLAPWPGFAQTKLPEPNWDERLALQTAQVSDSESRLENLFSLLRHDDVAGLEARLDALIRNEDLSAPARDYILHRFTVGLADFESIDPALVDRLRAVKPAVRVPHPESAEFGVPLYDISGAAEGVYHLSLRRQAQSEARQALGASPQAWLDAYLLAAPPQRAGFVDALDDASEDELLGVLPAASVRLPGAPDLTPVVGKAALLLGASATIGEAVRFGRGDALPRILEAAARTLPQSERLALLRLAVLEAPPANAALAIAQLYPDLAVTPEASPEATDLLFDTLDHAELGAAAAMALAQSGGVEARARLQQLSDDGAGLAAARARTALALEPLMAGDRP